MASRGTPALLLFALILLAAGPLAAQSTSHQAPSTPVASPVAPADAALYEAVSPDHRHEVMMATAGRLSRYTVAATLHPAGEAPSGSPVASPVAQGANVATPIAAAGSEQTDTISGTLEVRFVNATGATLPELYVRLYPNAGQYADGDLTVRDLTVNGRPLTYASPSASPTAGATPLASPVVQASPGPGATPVADAAPVVPPEEDDPTLLRVPLPDPLRPGDTATVALAFTTTVPTAPPEGSGTFAVTPETGTWALAGWFPMLAGYDPLTGWEIGAPGPWGDPLFADAALFDVTLAAPRSWTLATTGVQVERRADGHRQIGRFVTGPARDFTVVAGDDVETLSQEVGGTTVAVSVDPLHAAGAPQILTWAAAAVEIFNDLFGPYPYAELDVVDVPGVIGYEFSQLIYIGSDYIADPYEAGTRPDAVEFLVAHEIAHQWWYGLVGNNQYRHAFLDEGLAEYSAILYFEHRYGVERASWQVDEGLELRYATMLLTAADQIVDQPTAGFPDGLTYFTTVYRKAALGLAALRERIGDDAFLAGLRAYSQAMRFAVAHPNDLRAAFERTSGQDLSGFWHQAFERPEGRVIILVTDEPTPGTPVVATPLP